MKKLWAACFCVISAGCYENREADPLKGEWQLESMESEGETYPIPEGMGFSYHFKGNGRVSTKAPPQDTVDHEYEIDQAVEPNAITIYMLFNGSRISGMLGIFRLQGDKLELVLNLQVGPARPKEFRGIKKDKDNDFVLMVFRRVVPNL